MRRRQCQRALRVFVGQILLGVERVGEVGIIVVLPAAPAVGVVALQKPVPVQEQRVSSDTAMIVPKVKETLRAMMEEDKRKETSPEEDEEILIKRMAVPVWSAAQIADVAKNQGDAPEIIKDDVTKVTLFDYSDIIAEEKKLPTEE